MLLITELQEYLRRIVAVTGLLEKQGIFVSMIKQSSDNQGNFREMMKHLEEFDFVVVFLQNNKAPHSMNLSPSSQNEMIERCAGEVIANIINEMKKSKMYAVTADEERDGYV